MAKLGTGATSFSVPGAIEVELCSGDRDDCGEAAKLRTCRDFETPRDVFFSLFFFLHSAL